MVSDKARGLVCRTRWCVDKPGWVVATAISETSDNSLILPAGPPCFSLSHTHTHSLSHSLNLTLTLSPTSLSHIHTHTHALSRSLSHA